MLRIALSLCLLLGVCCAQGTVALEGFYNQTVNGRGSGGGCPTAVPISTGLHPLDIEVSSFSGAPLFGAIAGSAQCNALAIPGAWSVDLELSSLFVWFGGSTTPPGLPPAVVGPAGRLALNLNPNLAPGVIASQFAIVHPWFTAGLGTTQVIEMVIQAPLCPGGTSLANLGNDNAIQVNLAAPFVFYGTAWNEVFVNMNGNLSFCQPVPDWTPSPSEFVQGAPRIAPLWDDFYPGDPHQGSLHFFEDAQGFCVEWRDLRSFGLACGDLRDTNSFALSARRSDGEISFSYGIVKLCRDHAPSTDSLVGITPGGAGPCAPILPVVGDAVDLWSLGAPNSWTGSDPQAAIFEAFTPLSPFDLDRAGTQALRFTPLGGVGTGPYLLH